MQIAFSGKLGSGKSTVCAILRDKYGYEIYSTGTVQRKVAEEMNISTLELNKRMKEDPKLDHIIDDAVAKLSRERKGDRLVYDSRMAWHFAENTFKVYMYVDPTVAAERVFNADRGDVEKYASVDDAKEQLRARSEEENVRFKDIYGVDNFDYANYDLIIDSTYATPEDIADLIIKEAEAFETNAYDRTKLWLSPYTILPTKEYGADDGDITKIIAANGLHYAVEGHSKLAVCQSGKGLFMQAELGDDTDVCTSRDIVSQYESEGGFTYTTLPY